MAISKASVAKQRKKLAENSRKFGKCAKSCMENTFTLQNLRKKIPITLWLPNYKLNYLIADAIAGLTIALTVIPHSLACAQIAEIPTEYGLYSAFMCSFVYCIFGTSKDLSIGPTVIMALFCVQFGQTPIKGNPTYIIILTMITGIIQLSMGIFNLGFAVNFISTPVVSAFSSAAALVVAWSQVKQIFGIKGLSRNMVLGTVELLKRIGETNYWDLILGVICITLIVLLKKLKELGDDIEKKQDKDTHIAKKICMKLIWFLGTARNALVVMSAAVVAAVLQQKNIEVFTLTGELKPGLPPFKFPNLTLDVDNATITAPEIFSDIGVGLLIVPLVSVLQTVAIAKSFAVKSKYKVDCNQEIIALGFINFISSFVSAFPLTGSFSRTSLNYQTGVHTPAGGIVTGSIVLIALAVLTPYFYYIPIAALGAMVIVALISTLEFGIICSLWKIKKMDLIPYAVTFIVAIAAGIEWGIISGIAVSLLMVLYPAARPKIRVNHEKTDDCSLEEQLTAQEQEITPMTSFHDIVIIQPNLGLIFPGVEFFNDKILEETTKDNVCDGVVIDCSHISAIDYTAVQNITGWHKELLRFDAQPVFACVEKDVLSVLLRAKIEGFQCCSSVEDACNFIKNNKSSKDVDIKETHVELIPMSEQNGAAEV